MMKVTIPVKRLRRVLQRAKDLREHNVTVSIQKGAVYFKVGNTMADIVLVSLEEEKKHE